MRTKEQISEEKWTIGQYIGNIIYAIGLMIRIALVKLVLLTIRFLNWFFDAFKPN